MKKRLLLNLFSSGLQSISIQVLGVFFFYFISLYISKDSFGIISWGNATAMLLTTILSCGMEQVIVRRIATSESSDWAATAYFLHALLGSIITFVMLLFIKNVFKSQNISYNLLPWFFVVQAITFIATPLKQLLNAKEKFAPYGIIAFVSNLSKLLLAFFLWKRGFLSIDTTLLILAICASFEFLALLIYVLRKTDFNFKVRVIAYKKLLKESLPQYLSVIFDMSLSRMDWILLGILSTNIITADYSFAYRAFEVAKLPLIVIAPLLLVRLSKMLSFNKVLDIKQQEHLNQFFIIEIFIALLIVLCLNIIWGALVSVLTHGKYGESNAIQFFLLSVCIPLQFFINMLWTICFASKNYKIISVITIYSAVSNLILNLILIPYYGGLGAASSYIITNIIQVMGYYIFVRKKIMLLNIRSFIILIFTAIASYFISIWISNSVIINLLAVCIIFLLLSVLLKQIRKEHLSILQYYFKK